MKLKLKQITACLLAVAMLLCCIGFTPAYAEEEPEDDPIGSVENAEAENPPDADAGDSEEEPESGEETGEIEEPDTPEEPVDPPEPEEPELPADPVEPEAPSDDPEETENAKKEPVLDENGDPIEEFGDPLEVADEPILAAGTQMTGSFAPVSGYDIATVRYLYSDNGVETYGFAEISGSSDDGYTYSFAAPVDGFAIVQGSNRNPVDGATVIAEYYNLSKWDGAVDVTWYNESDSDFYLYTPAQLAGFAAIVNGSVDGNIRDYQVKGTRSNPADRSVNRGLPDYIESTYFDSTNLIAGVVGSAYKGVMKHDFADRTVHIMADMDMGGVDGSQVEMGTYNIGIDNPEVNWNRNLYDYPNWTPIGGEYLMDVTDSDSMIIAFFNGTIDGHGHNIRNLYCYRWSYRTVGSTAYGYSQGVGFVGDMGTLYDDSRGTESNPAVLPAIRNLGLYGFVYGRRMVGGFVGCIGGGSNAADGTSVNGGICLENLANHAYVYCTDSKGLGGIAGCSMTAGSIVNCYNDGYLRAEYAAPTGGIVGSNEAMDVFCCYSVGTAYAMQNRARGIGGDNAGKNYTVDSCYYLENTGNDLTYPGYYTYNLAPSVKVNVTEVSEAQMKSASVLEGLNVNGTAYVTGGNGYPVLYWEKSSGTGSLTVTNPQGGSVSAGRTGNLPNGSVVYLNNTADTGWNFRGYTLNGNLMTGDYVTVNGSSTISAQFESAKAGVLKVAANSVCDITVTKNGVVMENGEATTVTNYPVQEGDSIYEGDTLIVQASIKPGKVPADPALSYCDSVGAANPYEFHYQYTGMEATTTNSVTYKVGSEINGEDVSLTLTVVPMTTEKLWKYNGVTDWYSDSETEFVISTPEQLAGLELLVGEGKSFSGKTVKLGADISLENNDGTEGARYWDGIGLPATLFSGTFDGQGHSITGYHGNRNGLFAYIYGTSATNRAAVKNLNLYGDCRGQRACGIASYAKYADFENCNVYVRLKGTTGYSAGIVGYAQAGCTIDHCFNYGNINGIGKVAGIAGETSSTTTVENCINKGDIFSLSVDGNSVGGVVGSLNGKLTASANYGNVTAWGRNVGGVVGQSVSSSATITDCYNVGDVTLTNCSNQYDCVGGVVGFASYYKVYNTFNYGDVVAAKTVTMSGGVFGRESAKSTSVTEHVYYRTDSSEYAENNIRYEDLPDLTYCAGIQKVTEAEFAQDSVVLNAINTNSSFVLTNGRYPELAIAAGTHAHSGGTATCTAKAVCDICGLEYGTIDPNVHNENLLKRNASEAAWTTNGYTGDMTCRDCGTVVIPGEVIAADTTRHAITIHLYRGEELVDTKDYTVAQFDRLKLTSPAVAYSYGGENAETAEKMVATEYVTIDRLAGEFGYELADLLKIDIICIGSESNISHEVLTTCNKYYEDGIAYDAPPALSMHYGVLSGNLETVAHESKPSDSLRFGFGVSEEQYQNHTSLGGRRLVSPVNVVNLYVEEAASGVTVSGSITGYAGANTATVTLTRTGESTPRYETQGTANYCFEAVEPGEYTLRVSADSAYVDHTYVLTVEHDAVSQNVTIYQLGDVSMDGAIKANDATLISRHQANIKRITDPYAQLLADVNRDGKVSIADASCISQYVAKIISAF